MLETLKNAWRVKELRNKLFFTLFIIFIFRLGSVIPVPFIDIEGLAEALKSTTEAGGGNTFFSYLNVLTGGAMQYGALFAMSVTPYINASIIMQLLTVAIPPLERIAKEGEDGQKKIAKYTRFATVILGMIQGGVYYVWLYRSSLLKIDSIGAGGGVFPNIFIAVVIILCFTAGSAMMMWLGEKIDERGVGNGISILLFAGIISQVPTGAEILLGYWKQGKIPHVIIILLILAATIVFVVWMYFAERRIPIQYAKRVVGRKQYGGSNTHMPIKVNMGGVMPIIFANSILSIPTMILAYMKDTTSTMYQILALMSYQSWIYAFVYLVLIIAFAFFYTTIQYNPLEMANNLRKNSGAIPGIRPGKPTQDFIQKILNKITLIGAVFLGAVAILPILIGQVGGINISLGGTSLLIVVGVAIDTVQQLESQLMMRHYKGFLD
jgi:preprotein translocase subunit SecY